MRARSCWSVSRYCLPGVHVGVAVLVAVHVGVGVLVAPPGVAVAVHVAVPVGVGVRVAVAVAVAVGVHVGVRVRVGVGVRVAPAVAVNVGVGVGEPLRLSTYASIGPTLRPLDTAVPLLCAVSKPRILFHPPAGTVTHCVLVVGLTITSALVNSRNQTWSLRVIRRAGVDHLAHGAAGVGCVGGRKRVTIHPVSPVLCCALRY